MQAYTHMLNMREGIPSYWQLPVLEIFPIITENRDGAFILQWTMRNEFSRIPFHCLYELKLCFIISFCIIVIYEYVGSYTYMLISHYIFVLFNFPENVTVNEWVKWIFDCKIKNIYVELWNPGNNSQIEIVLFESIAVYC